jgi:HEAT repeat protein
VRTTAAWAVGRIGQAAWKAGPILIEMLRDTYWKVRTAACIALATAGQQVADRAISALSRLMKDGSINRDNVAETIVRLGPQGEQLLIEMLGNQPVSNFKLRKGIVHALSQANIEHNNIDFVIETLFKISGDGMA